jgi:2-dehydro-3-deoxygalactonokinase
MIKQFLSCDWGTSSFRLRLIHAADGSILAETIKGKGIAAVHNEWLKSDLAENERAGFYKNILLSQIKKLSDDSLGGIPIIISGMASSSIGIADLPYTNVPFVMGDMNLSVHRISPDKKFQHEILIVSGIKTGNDAIRGEETMLLGCKISEHNDHLIIFPGTHSKHVIVQNNVVKDFKTYMTGELFNLLSAKSILAMSVEKSNISGNNIQQFIKGINESISSNLLNNIFHVRTNGLFGGLNKKENYHYLSGLLIGEELKNIQKENYGSVTLVSTGILSTLYSEALSAIGFRNILQLQNADEALIRGQVFILNQYQ